MQGKLRQEELEYWLRKAFLLGVEIEGGAATEWAAERAEKRAMQLAKEWMASHEN